MQLPDLGQLQPLEVAPRLHHVAAVLVRQVQVLGDLVDGRGPALGDGGVGRRSAGTGMLLILEQSLGNSGVRSRKQAGGQCRPCCAAVDCWPKHPAPQPALRSTPNPPWPPASYLLEPLCRLVDQRLEVELLLLGLALHGLLGGTQPLDQGLQGESRRAEVQAV